MPFNKIQHRVGRLTAWALAMALASQISVAWSGDPLDPVPARYCSQNDELFWYFQISDTHIGAWGSQDRDYLEWAVTEAKSVIDPAFIIATGDLTDSTNCDDDDASWLCSFDLAMPDGPHLAEWQQYRDTLCLDCPEPYVDATDFFDLPGNHDVYSDADASYYLLYSVQGQATARTQASWTRQYGFGKYYFLGLNTAANDGSAFSLSFPYGDHAGLDPSELSFIENELALHSDAVMTILFAHHPMDETGVGGDTWIFYGADELAALMNAYGISTYGYGHTHRYAEELFTGRVEYDTGTPYAIDPTDPGRGVFYFNVNSLGKSQTQNLQITAIDCNGISTITRDADRWPMVMITAPVDIDLGVTDTPFYLGYAVTNAPDNPIRALAFDAGTVTAVQYRVDGVGDWRNLDHVNGPLWAGTWDASGLSEGVHSLQVQAMGAATDTDTINVYVQATVNQPPTAAFSYHCTDLACSFDGSGSTDSDGTIASYDWDFGDGNGDSGATASHSYAAADTYSVVLTVTDEDGATDTQSQSVTVGETPAVHVGDLDASSADAARNRWDATVDITVHDDEHAGVSGATVEGRWSDGANSSCTTDSGGACSVAKTNNKSNVSSITFSVTNVTAVAGAYVPEDNHDPDVDSNGTTITVNKPG